jgi:hypothetical protein
MWMFNLLENDYGNELNDSSDNCGDLYWSKSVEDMMNERNQPEDLAFWKEKAVKHRMQFEADPTDETAEMLLMLAEDQVEEIEEMIFV